MRSLLIPGYKIYGGSIGIQWTKCGMLCTIIYLKNLICHYCIAYVHALSLPFILEAM